jgi:hypothetical protein
MSGGGGGGGSGIDMNGDGGGEGDAGVRKTVAVASSGASSTVTTFTIENLLYTAALTASCWFASHYFSFFRIPALAFMFVDTVSVMASINAASTILIFSIRPKRVGGAFSDCVLAEVSQGFAIVSSLMWLVVLFCMFIDVPRIAAVPGFPASASAIALAVVLGFSVVIPFLALVITYAAVPAGSGNSLLFNGSTVGAACLLFFVTVSFGNGGVMKCYPHTGTYTSIFFFVCVLSYWGVLLLLEIAVFGGFDPLESILTSLGNDKDRYERFMQNFQLSWIEINLWRIIGCLINIMIVATSLLYTDVSLHGTVVFAGFVVVLLHVPLIITIKFDWFGTYKGDPQIYEQVPIDGQYYQPNPLYPQYEQPNQLYPQYEPNPLYPQNYQAGMPTAPYEQPNAAYPQNYQDGMPTAPIEGMQSAFPVYPVVPKPIGLTMQTPLQRMGISNLFPLHPTTNKNVLSTEPRHRRNVHTRFS